MNLKKISFLIIFLLPTCKIFAKDGASNNSIDFLLGGGSTSLYYDDGTDNSNSGVNLFLSGLYSLVKTRFGSPVIGLGISGVASNDNSSTNINNNSQSVKINSFQYNSYYANIGFKFIPSDNLSIFVLGNAGKAYYNSISGQIINNSSRLALVNFSYNVDDHSYYGGEILAIYQLFSHFGIGLGLIYNRHLLHINSVTYTNSNFGLNGTSNLDENSNFNEASANITLAISF